MKQAQTSSFMEKAKMYPGHYATLLAMAAICANLWVTPTGYIQSGGRVAWLVAALSYLSGLLLILIGWGLARQFPSECFPEYVPKLLGNVFGRAYLLLFAAGLIINITEDMRNSVLVATAGLLVYTPVWVTVVVLTALGTYLAWTGHIRMARGAAFYFSTVVATFVVTLILTHRWMDFGYLRPWLDFSEWKPATLPFWGALASFRGVVVLAMLYPYVQKQQKVLLYSVGALTGAALILLLATLAAIAVLGLQGALYATRPYAVILTTIFFADAPFETFDFFARLALLSNSIFTVAVMAWAAGRIIRITLWKKANDGWFIIGVGALAASLEVVAQRAVPAEMATYWIMILVSVLGLSMAPLIPLAMLKSRRDRRQGAQGGGTQGGAASGPAKAPTTPTES